MTATSTSAPPLAKYLASTDKRTRDKSIKNLSIFLSDPSHDELSKEEMDKLWKGIFYCFWMSDKPLVQQALATELGELLLMITSTNQALAFLRGFWETTVREWSGIDRLRIDKYYMLVRRYMNASFRLLLRTKWDKSACETHNEILSSQGGPLCPSDLRVPTGLAYHLADAYLEELEKVMKTSDSPSPVPLQTILQPFFTLASQTPNSKTYTRIQSSLFEPLLRSTSPSSNSDEDRNPKRARLAEVRALYPNILENACLVEAGDTSSSTELKDGLCRAIFDAASQPDTKDTNRRKLYKLWRENVDEDDSDE